MGCGSSGKKQPTPSTADRSAAPAATAATGPIKPVLLGSEFIQGEANRFPIGLLTDGNKLVKDADVHLKFFTIDGTGNNGSFRGEGDAQLYEVSIDSAHAHDSSPQGASADTIAFYVATAPFDQAGRWGVEVTATPKSGGAPITVQAPFTVLDQPHVPAQGQIPPASKNDTFATNSAIETLCSRTPACSLHDKVIGDVLGKGRPLVVQFSTPAFCQTRFCGPVLEVLLSQVPAYKDRVDFVHIEVWQDFQTQKFRPAMAEWGLQTEPWTFFMSSDGKVAGHFESIFSEVELVDALDQLVKL